MASNASSTSTGLLEASEHGSTLGVAGASRPSRSHRSSSSLSSRGGFASTPNGIADRPPSSGIAPPRDTMAPHPASNFRHVLGRHESVASSMVSNAGSYSMGSTSAHQGDSMPSIQQRSTYSSSQIPASPTSVRSSIIGGVSRLDEISQFKADLESARRENEVLRHRIRELEGLKVSHRSSAASIMPNTAPDRSSVDQEDDIQVGESALSKGLT